MWSLVVMIYLINTTAGGGASSNVVTVGQYQTEESCKAAGEKIGGGTGFITDKLGQNVGTYRTTYACVSLR
jgi:hypothetical protein